MKKKIDPRSLFLILVPPCRKRSKKVSPYFSHTFLGWPNFWAFSTHVTVADKQYQSSPFRLLYSIPSKSFQKYSSEISRRQWEFCQNCHMGKPFSSQGLPELHRIGPWFLFPQIYFERVTNCTELIQIQLMWDTFRCVTCMENAQKFGQPKKA